jgi:hypothetical protein
VGAGSRGFEPVSAEAQPVSGRLPTQISDIEKSPTRDSPRDYAAFGANPSKFLARDWVLGRKRPEISPLPRLPEIHRQRPRWLADDPVLIALVSGAKFPANREINREFFKFGAVSPIRARVSVAISVPCSKIPYEFEQGIFLPYQGRSREYQGNNEITRATASTVAGKKARTYET